MSIAFRDNYESIIANSDGLILVDFWGLQCQPCLALMPTAERLEKDYQGQF